MAQNEEEFSPCAVWIPDRLGSSDFDGRLLSFEMGSWPASHHIDGRARGHAEIFMNFGVPGDDVLGDRLTWKEELRGRHRRGSKGAG